MLWIMLDISSKAFCILSALNPRELIFSADSSKSLIVFSIPSSLSYKRDTIFVIFSFTTDEDFILSVKFNSSSYSPLLGFVLSMDSINISGCFSLITST